MTFVDLHPDHAETDFTVVAREWRGRGLGQAIKAASVLALLDGGVTRFRTAARPRTPPASRATAP